MILEDFDGSTSITDARELRDRLVQKRSGTYGSFMLTHEGETSTLAIMFHGDFAFVYFFPDDTGDHPGFQVTGMTPEGCPESLFFVQPDNSEAGGFDIPAEFIIPPNAAYAAAEEFFGKRRMPECVTWFEL